MAKKKKKVVKNKISAKGERIKVFIRAFLENGGNATRAYMVAFPNATYNTARTESSKLLAKPNIIEKLQSEYELLWKQKDLDFEKSKVYKSVQLLGKSNIADIVNIEDGTLTVRDMDEIPPEALETIQSIKFTKKLNKMGGIDENLEVKMHPKLQALELLCRIQKMINDKLEGDFEIIVKPAVRPTDIPDEAKAALKEKENDDNN